MCLLCATCLEICNFQFSYPHTRGSSHGQTRITRTSYSEPEYAALMPEAFRRWKDLQNEAKKELYV